MHEDLLGYLLGALEPDEMRRVSQWLREDPDAREQLADLERLVRPLEDGYCPVDPPPSDLVSRTLAMLPAGSAPQASEPADANSAMADGSGRACTRQVQPASHLVPMQTAVDCGDRATVRWVDWFGGAVAAAVVLGLLLPALAQGRFESRKTACQDQLRQLGTALTQFVTRSPQARLPAVSQSGPEAFAGIYALRLNDCGLMEDPDLRWCPSLDMPSANEATLTSLGEVASIEELYRVSVDSLKQIQRYAGGHYAYNLGVVEKDRFAAPRFEARSTFAVMSDAPQNGIATGDGVAEQVSHGGVGINVLFEDGRVQFIPLDGLAQLPDHPLENHRGNVEAGINIDDASLAPSFRPPFIDVTQR